MRLRSLVLGTTLLLIGTAVGATTQHLASAGVSSGDRPVLISITPCRLADTRPAPSTIGPRSSPLGVGDTHTIDAQEPGTPCSGLIPDDASALSLNITALGATELSFLTVWPGGERPNAASLNPAPGQPPVPNAVTTELSVDQEFEIYNASGTVNIVVDVNGFYVDHDHDDRYYTRDEVDAAIDTAVKALADATDTSLAELESAIDAVDAKISTEVQTAIDTYAGREKSINLDVFRDVDSLTADRRFGNRLTRYSTSVVLPPDYTPGTDMRLEVTMSGGAVASDCSVQLLPDHLDAYRPLVGDLNDDGGTDTDGLVAGPDPVFPAGSTGYVATKTFTVSAPGSVAFEPGDILSIVLDGDPLGCGLTFIRGSALYYS